MLKSEIDFKSSGDLVEIWWESDRPPFDDVLMGCLRKDDDGYYRFYPASKSALTSKHLRILAAKCSELNVLGK